MNIAIVDDNLFHLSMIGDKVKRNVSIDFELKYYNNAQEYKNDLLKNKSYDIVLLDIDLGEDSGITLANMTNNLFPYTQIIYITAYANYASDVYETEHIYYIDKEQIDKYLPLALNKAINNIQKMKSQILSFSWKKQEFQISQKDILYIERKKRITYIITQSFTYQTPAKLNDLLLQLNDLFICCHNSYIVNLKQIAIIQRTDIILKNGTILPISRSHAKELKQAYNKFLINEN